MGERLADRIRSFIIQSFIPGERPENLPEDLDLIKSGILDSLALIEMASYLEELVGGEIEHHELTPVNVGSIGAMVSFVERRRNTES